ncbi:MAG: DMT family transporter [Deltaproteobacteria bacterium]|nr:DMT family transporter [Deltaproteobacteria bacterium]
MSSTWLALGMLLFSGVLIAVQATVDVALGRSLGLCFFAFIFTVVQLVACLPPLVLEWPLPWEALARTPWWQYVGGALGMPILLMMAWAMGKSGSFAGLVALLVGQLAMGLMVDRFGLFGAPFHPITPARLAGFVLVLAGLILAKQ